VALNNGWNMYEWVCIHGQVQFVGNKLIHIYHLHGRCVMLSVSWLCGCRHIHAFVFKWPSVD